MAKKSATLIEQGYRACKRCKGTGKRKGWSDTAMDYVPTTCDYCEGKGAVPPLDEQAIRAALKGRNGLRTSPPCGGRKRTLAECRAYYVWRLARFNGGVDMTMPMVAGLFAGDDAFLAEMNTLSETIATETFGTSYAAVRAWGRVL